MSRFPLVLALLLMMGLAFSTAALANQPTSDIHCFTLIYGPERDDPDHRDTFCLLPEDDEQVFALVGGGFLTVDRMTDNHTYLEYSPTLEIGPAPATVTVPVP